MQRVNIFKLKPTPEQEKRLLSLLEYTSHLFNEANYQRRQALFNNQKIPTAFDQNKVLKHSKNWKELGTGMSQELMAKINESWRSYLALKKKGTKKKDGTEISPPKYWKDRRNSTVILKSIYCRNDCYYLKDRNLYLPHKLKIKIAGERLWEGKQGRLEIHYIDGKFYGYQTVEVADVPQKSHGNSMYIDLGAKNLSAIYMEGKQPILFSGRKVLSDWVYWEKKIAMAKSELPKNKKTSKRIDGMFHKRGKRIKHYFQSLGKKITEIAEQNNVSYIYIGDTTQIRKSETRMRAQVNQVLFNFWSYGRLINSIKNKAEAQGIGVELIDERYTSRTCPRCGDARKSNRRHRGLFVCKHCGFAENADCVGAINIYRKVSGRSYAPTSSGLKTQPLLFKWGDTTWKA